MIHNGDRLFGGGRGHEPTSHLAQIPDVEVPMPLQSRGRGAVAARPTASAQNHVGSGRQIIVYVPRQRHLGRAHEDKCRSGGIAFRRFLAIRLIH